MTNTRRWDFFSLEPTDVSTPFRLMVPSAELLEDQALIDSKTSVVLAIDLGHAAAEHAGIVVPFLRLPVSFAWVELERRDGRYRYVEHRGRNEADGLAGFVAEIDARMKSRFHDRPAFLQQFGMRAGGFAKQTPADELTFTERGVGWCWGPDVFWAQAGTRDSYGVPTPDWIYAGMIASFTSGCEFAFYRPDTQRLRLIVETT